jgi:hypothetical protein
MLRYMERSTIQYLKKRGWSNQQIAEFTGHHRDTIARVLREPVDRLPAPRSRPSAIQMFDEQITQWLENHRSSTRMLELARAPPEHPYQGGNTAFYTYVRKRRRAQGQFTTRDVALRFAGLPGEYVQVDWGELGRSPGFSFWERSTPGPDALLFCRPAQIQSVHGRAFPVRYAGGNATTLSHRHLLRHRRRSVGGDDR